MSLIVKEYLIDKYIDKSPDISWNLFDDLVDRLEHFNIDTSICTAYVEYLRHFWYGMGYHLIPLAKQNEYTDIEYFHDISKFILIGFLENINTLNRASEDIKLLKDFTFNKNSKTIYGKNIDKNEDNKNMGEISPITSGANIDGTPNFTIDTPNSRLLNVNTNKEKQSGEDNYSETNPYYYGEFMRILDKYNIFDVFHNSTIKVVQEYIEVI